MSRRLWLAGVLVFSVTVLAYLPAAGVVRLFNWPSGWQPEQVSGTLWNGQVQRAGVLGPVSWQLRPWRGEARVQAGLGQQFWALTVSGWPWSWRAQLLPGTGVASATSDYLIDGSWQGSLHLVGQGSRCVSSHGELQGQDIALLAPWTLSLGKVQLHLDCQQGLQGVADVRREGEHHLQARAQVVSGRAQLRGELQPDAPLAPLLVQAGLLKAGEQRFERVLGPR